MTPALSEKERLAVVRQYVLPDADADSTLSEACRLATLLCHRPMAAVEFVLEDKVAICAAAGLHAGLIAREEALCSCLMDRPGLVVVRDTAADPCFSQRRLVLGGQGVRFYAGVPLVSPEGVVLGRLSVWDWSPGDLMPSQAESLETLGRMVMGQLNLARRQRQLVQLEAEHARVEDALREAESKFRGIFENTVVGIYQTTPEGRYISANPMLARIYGYESPDELIHGIGNIGSQLYVDPSARERFVAALQQQDTIVNFEAQIRRKDGSVIWIAENARVVRDCSGKAVFYEGTVQDITARRAAEDQLRNSEMLYHSLVEELPQNIFRKDTHERFIFANSRFCETVERSLEDILDKTDFDLYSPELARKYQEDDQRVIAEGRSVRVTERNVTPDGAVHWVEVVKSPLRDVTGAVTGIQGIFWDVTEPKRLQDALAYERDLLQALLDHSPDIIYFKDPESRFVKVSRALARRFNRADPESLVGQTAFDLLPRDRAEAVHAEEQELLRTGEPLIHHVEELVDHGGHVTWASVTKVPIYNRAGETLGLVGVARDITQLIETEQALREAEEKYRTIFENSVEGIFQTTPEGRFIRVNPALARIYGYASPEELMESLIDVRTQVYVDPKRREEFVNLVLQTGSITGFESEIRRADGTTTWVSESARAVRDREGRLVYFEGTLEDISVRKQIEREREEARRAALESARLKSEFVATVSHEIRTPLNAIVPNAERLLETRLDAQQRYLVESIDHGAHMLLQIVNDILDLSKIEAGAVTLEDIDFDVHEVIERTMSFFASPAHEKGLELVGDIGVGVPRHLRGDPSRLGQVLNNLVGNALKFTETGEVVVRVEVGDCEEGRVELRFSVRDTGIGIAPQARGRVFQAFAQADGSMSRRYGGTGLGLAITRKFVELMGGSIDFESELGMGTTFRFSVRLRPARWTAAAEVVPSLLAGLRVLVLEDNASQRAALAAGLAGLGAERIEQASGIDEALERLRAAASSDPSFHLIFFDSELPGSDGLQTARRLRAGGAAASRLVALTPPGTGVDARSLEAAGVLGFLVKPLRRSRLARDISILLAGGREATGAGGGESTAPGTGLAVLLVEDHPLNQRVASEMLERLGAGVHAVSSGQEAVEAFERKRYDLLFMDCQMPDMDGYETTQRIRALEERMGGRPVPIVGLSANALSGDRERGLAAGMDDYLTKPLRQPELIRVLRQVAEAAAGAGGDNGIAARLAGRTTAPGAPAPAAAGEGETVLPVLDPGPLAALASPEDPSVLPEFVNQFISDAPRRISRMRDRIAAGAGFELVAAESHSLKGSSSYMGASRLVAACASLEQGARSAGADPASLTERLDAVEAAFHEARKALEAYLANPAASQ